MFTQASVGGSLKNLQGQLLHNNEEICVIFNMCAQNSAFTEGIQPQPMETKESNLNTGISRKKGSSRKKISSQKGKRQALLSEKQRKNITQVIERRKQLRSEKSTQPLTRHVAKKKEGRDEETERREASRTAAQERRE